MFPIKSSQIILLCLTLKVKVCEEITPRSTTVNAVENLSVNVICTVDDSNSSVVILNIDGNQGAITTNGCHDEGSVATEKSEYGFYCLNNNTVIVTLKSVQQTSLVKTLMCRALINGTRVTVPVKSVTLSQTSAVLRTRETNETVIECKTSAGSPSSTIHWYQNGRRLLPSQSNIEITDISTGSYQMTTKSTLRIYPKRPDNSSILFCAANNTEDPWLYSDNITMLVYYGPDKPTLSMRSFTIQDTVDILSGHSLIIQCNSKGYPTPQYNWLTPNNSVIEGHTLTIPNVTYPNSDGIYTCQVNVSMELPTETEHRTNETSIRINVMYPPKTPYFLYNNDPNTTVNNHLLHVVSGDNFTVRCVSDSVPGPRYTWTGHEDDENVHHGSKSSDLIITSIRRDIVLICIATNVMVETHGTTLSKSAHSTLNIQVLDPPQKPEFFITNMAENLQEHKDNIDVEEGDTVVITCQANGRPKPDGYFWSSKPNINNATLEIEDVKPTEAGTYTCKAHNTMRRTFGEQKEGTNENDIMINVLCKPSSPSMFTNIEFLTTKSTITVSWRPGSDGGFRQVFVLRYRIVNVDEIWTTQYVRDSGEKDRTATLTSLSEGMVYEITVAAKNERGESAVSSSLFVLTQGKRQSKQDMVPDSYKDDVMIISGCLGGAILVGGVIIGLWICRKYYITKTNDPKSIHQSATSQLSHTSYDELCLRDEAGIAGGASDKNQSVIGQCESEGVPYEEIRMSRLVRGVEKECGRVEYANKPNVYENLKI